MAIAVVEGQSYTIALTITNQSAKDGVPIEVNLGVGISAAVDSLTLIPEQIASKFFTPNQTRTFIYSMIVPSGSGGQSGPIIARVEDPTGRVIAQGTENVFVEALPPPEPTDEELIYANWLRTGGTGSIAYWRSLGSPLYYTPPPEPEPTKYHWYRVTFIDGSVSNIPVPYVPGEHISLWDVVDRDSVLSQVYLGYY